MCLPSQRNSMKSLITQLNCLAKYLILSLQLKGDKFIYLTINSIGTV